jgi:DGQHR domain-containing protein
MTDSSNDALSALGLALPALRGTQGGRTFYVTLPTNAVLTGFFPSEVEGSEDRSQRPLDPTHARHIRDYIVANPIGFALGALVYAVDKSGSFEEVVPGSGIGVLRLPLDAHLRSIDGQHRREGLRQSISSVPDLQKQSTAALIYVEPDLAQRRQMFSDMNNTARKVSKALNVSYDSRDAFARAAARVSSEHLLLAGRVERAGARVVPGSGNLYTLAAVYDALKRLFVGPVGRVKDSTKFDEGEIVARGTEFFDALAASRTELDPTTGSADSLDQLRSESILLSSTTLRVLASAVWTAGEDLGDVRAAMAALGGTLAQLDFSPSAAEWQDSGFVSPGRSTPNARSQEMRAATNRLAALLGVFAKTAEGVTT